MVIGSGFGGLNAAKKLKRADVDIKLIARTTHHLFQPLLYQVATGIISEGEIAPPTRVILRRQRNVQVLLGEVTHIDLSAQTVDSDLLGHTYRTPYDSLIVAAGAGQSYFGNDQFAEFAPGMKTIDDALELRGRILGAFEQAERPDDPDAAREAAHLRRRRRRPDRCRDGRPDRRAGRPHAEGRVPAHRLDQGPGDPARRRAAPCCRRWARSSASGAATRLEKMGVEIQLDAMVTDVDRDGITVKDTDGTIRRIESACKVWSAGVSASPLGKDLADQSGGRDSTAPAGSRCCPT